MQFKGLGVPNKYFAKQNKQMYIRLYCLLALRTIKLPFQSSRVIFLGKSPAEEHLPGIIQAKECMKKKKHISEEQHYLCEIGLEKMPMDLPGSTNLIQRKASRTSRLRPIIMWTRLFFKLPLQHGEIYGITVPRFASWYPPSIWKAI